jgi:hypothetical protein
MKLEVSRADVWVASMKDKPGGLAAKLKTLAEAGANLEFVIARRDPKRKGRGVVFLTPIRGAKQAAAARKAGLRKSKSIIGLSVAGPDKAGMGAMLTGALGEAGINLRGLSAARVGKRAIVHLALDSPADATKAARVLRKL